MSTERVYVRLDADSVGERLELFLLKGRISEAEQLHEAIQAAMKQLRHRVLEEGFDVLFAGCDDALFSGPSSLYKRDFLEQLRDSFVESTHCTLSCGVGFSMADALQNLRIAKLAGRDQIVEPNDR
jgi:minimal CRISPR polymerase domain